MNVYRRELRAGRRSVIFWCLGIFLFIAASMQKYAALATDPASLDIMYQLPSALQGMFGVGELDFTTVGGFYGMIYPYLLLMAAVHASMLGAVILSKEERDRTGEFLYTKPESRARILTEKLLAALSQVVFLNVATCAASLAMAAAFGADIAGTIALLMAGMLLVQLLFLALGVAAAAVVARPKAAPGIATGFMLATYLLSVAIDVNGRLGALRALTPFEYFDAGRIVGRGEGLPLGAVALALGISAVLLALAYARFSRRDLKV